MKSESLREFLSRKRGRAAAMAAALKVSPSLVSLWATGARVVPVARCLEIERYTKGIVRVTRLRPDVAFNRWRKK